MRCWPNGQRPFRSAPSPSGKAEVCKTSIPGSNPGGASNFEASGTPAPRLAHFATLALRCSLRSVRSLNRRVRCARAASLAPLRSVLESAQEATAADASSRYGGAGRAEPDHVSRRIVKSKPLSTVQIRTAPNFEPLAGFRLEGILSGAYAAGGSDHRHPFASATSAATIAAVIMANTCRFAQRAVNTCWDA